MWGSDYPHDEGSHPYTKEHLRARFSDVDPAEVRKMLSENAAKFYDFDLDALAPLAAKIGPTVAEVATPIDDIPVKHLERISGDMDTRPSSDRRSRRVVPSRTRGPGRPRRRPAPHVRRLTLNRPEKRNALNHPLRGQLIAALQAADLDDDVHVTIVRGAGTSFSAGYDLGRRQRGSRHAALHVARRGPVAPPRHRDLDGDLGSGRSPSSRRSTATAWPAAASWPPGATSSTWPRTPRWATPRCASACPTCSSTPGCSACGPPWR